MLFREIIGQEDIKRRLIQTVKDNRVSHAQLFLGGNGRGKLALAIAYAQYINCHDRTEDDSCGICPSCVKYNKLAHPDLHFIYPVASNKEVKKPTSKDFIAQWRELLIQEKYYININDWFASIDIENKQAIINKDDCNSIIKTLSYKSYEAEYKVMIIWMAEKLFYAAAPKILKILEEPPEKTLFILISENQEQILNTILSRTQIIKFPALKDDLLKNALIERLNIDNDKAQSIVSISEGSYRNAIFNLNSSEDSSINFEYFRDWMRLCYQSKIAELTVFVGKFSKIGRERQKSFLNYALRISRSSLLINYENQQIAKLTSEEEEFMKKFSPFINPANIGKFAEEFNSAIFHIERNANPSILFTDLSLKAVKLLRIKA